MSFFCQEWVVNTLLNKSKLSLTLDYLKTSHWQIKASHLCFIIIEVEHLKFTEYCKIVCFLYPAFVFFIVIFLKFLILISWCLCVGVCVAQKTTSGSELALSCYHWGPGHGLGSNSLTSWANSLTFLGRILYTLHLNSQLALEYHFLCLILPIVYRVFC